MKVKKFKGTTMPEVMQVVRKELGGADAVILNSKVIHEGGFLGLFKKRKIEVLAAIDQTQLPKKKSTPLKTTTTQPVEITQKNAKTNQEDVLQEIREMKKWMQKQTNQQTEFSSSFQQVYDKMLQQEIDQEIAYNIIEAIQQRVKQEDLEENQVWSQVLFELKHRLSNKGIFGGEVFDKKFIHLVGPTGVGKTTTIAKLAADCVLNQQKKVAFITTDTYRIAAIEQLKTYSKILDVPIEIAYNLDDYQKAKEKFKDFDYVLVDTAGRNFRDEKYINELGKIVDLNQEVDTFLVLSLTTRSSDLEDIYQRFYNIPIKQLIFTKKDETKTYGPVLNLCLKHNIGVAYITNGQNVPDDIEKVSIEQIAKLVVGDE
ncbi:flagellar biosynthesis protein FlhF [Gracilibacillus boraciitolerans JCM 21714]|uniref:Flagellar biosynthesis protein FlhF n=1 Tax=Gracilibacillus boraciitolerans JCM 21714 TaxID=1298598 RepID=W4VFR7_9BACI|nr:flagellar biosynthesis protein FlhF [Gracilibacillus boraciitolerans]GAE91609.1 flagellar biosynthesis protein FlhF [Gracilibacillus boraciitolerans JCM 21714]